MSRIHRILDPKGCGHGRGPKCCAYLLANVNGFLCGRVTDLADQLRGRAVREEGPARRLPELPYPQCQREGL